MEKIKFTELNKTYLFLSFILLLILISLLSDLFILHENLYYDYFKDQLSYDEITKVLQLKNEWALLNYLIIPIIYLFKFFVLSMWILTGIILVGYKVSFRKVFHACILAEFVLLIPSVIGLFWFGFVKIDYTLVEVQQFHPFSLLSLFDSHELASWMTYPLQSFSLFQLVYVFVLSYGLQGAINQNYRVSLAVVFPVYISGILIWLTFITFLTINYSI
ncbi:MAG: hypothetical protein ORN54_14710 [Cyclobacteriaceae bacterium]|nr:hypothetical protein [Cyclobacteriaceae bacterium]